MQALPHTGSYYAATLNDHRNFASLAGDQHADVCVIGAGFTGISTALHLTERGYNVHVLEANRVGWGASGRNGGQLIGGISGEQTVAKHAGQEVETLFDQMRWEGHDIIRDRVHRYGIQCDLKPGYLDVAIKPRHVRWIQQEHERLERANFPYETRVLSGAETEALIGTTAYCGAMLNMGNGHLHPLNLCVGEARAAGNLGASIYERTPALEIIKGSRARVVSHKGSVTADAIVLAGNAYHFLEPELRNIMFPVNSFIIATQPLDEATVAKVNPRDLAVCDPNFVLEYFRLSADKRMLFGGRFNYFGDDPAVIKRRLHKKLARIYPQLCNVGIDFAWSGTIGVPLNRVPQMGRIAPNVFYCQGYSGHGVNVTHLAGRILADAVAGTLEHFDLFASIKPSRIPGAYRLRKPLVSLALAYYQIKDRLL